jgi:hypothetical protein
MVHPAEEPQVFHEFIRDKDAISRLRLFAETEKVVHDFESIFQKMNIETDTTR